MGWQISAGKVLQLYCNAFSAFALTKRHKTQSQQPITGLSLEIGTPKHKEGC